MSTFSIILNAIIPIFLIIGIGYVLKRTGWVTEIASMQKLALNLLFPCLVLYSTIGNKLLTHFGSVFLTAGLGFLSVVVGMGVAGLFGRFIGAKTPMGRRTFALSAGCQNDGYIPIPLALALFNQDTVGLIFVFGFGWDIAFWTVGMVVLSGGIKRDAMRHIVNPAMISIFAGLILNMAGAEYWMPAMVLKTFDWLGACCIPLVLLLTGMTLAEYASEFRLSYALRVVSMGVLSRIVIMGAILLAAAMFLPMPNDLRHVMILQAAMPAAIFPIIAAKHYGGDPLTAIKVVFGTSLVALFTAPLVIGFGMRYIP